MFSNNNVNTGLAAKVDAFRWSGATDNKAHVIGVMTSAPDFTIPPTPASSYQNIHVALDHIHPSSITTRTEVLVEPVQMRSVTLSAPTQGTANRSFSSLPTMDNKLDNIPFSSARLVPERIDPDQPMARSEAALTSLKSEIAPMTPAFVPLEEFDDLAERQDRELPPAVDLILFDETEALASKSLSKDWALKEEEERSWRMSRSLDQAWKSKWGLVSKQLSGKSFSLNTLEERERQWRMKRSINPTWAASWKQVGAEIRSYSTGIDLAMEDLTSWAANLTRDLEKEVDRIVKNVNAMGPAIEEIERTLNKQSWARVAAWEDEERKWRSAQSVDPVFYGNWHRVNLELQSVVGISWSEWFDNLKMKTLKKTSKAVDRIENFELPAMSLPSMPSVDLSGITMPSLPTITLPHVNLPDLKLGVVKSEATTPMYNDSEIVDFTFMSRRVPREIIDLEEAERSYRMSRGVNPIAYGLWFRAGQELKYKYALRPTFSGLGESLAEKASTFADKAMDTLGSLIESAQGAITSAEESLTPAPVMEFAEHKHLNMYAFTAEKIDFTFKSRRTPAYIIALEEAERADRIRNFNSTRAAYKRWNQFLVDSLPKSNIERAEGAIMSAVHMAESGISGFFGSIAGSIAHSVAGTLHMGQEAPIVSKDLKVDPLAAARKGRVNDELLHLTIKSV